MKNKWAFSNSAEYYDLILGKRAYERNSEFVAKELKKFKVNKVLELACGSGLYLIPLKKKGFDVEGLDISKEMLNIARKKDKTIRLYQKDMTKFNIGKKYDAILLMNSGLVLLPSFKLMERTIGLVYKHLKNKGIFLLDLPNHKKEIKEHNHSETTQRYLIPNGRIDVIFKDYKKGNKWISEWDGLFKRGNTSTKFKEYYEELIYSPKAVEKSLKDNQFKILKVFGSRLGGKFNSANSWRRFYLCQKHSDSLSDREKV